MRISRLLLSLLFSLLGVTPTFASLGPEAQCTQGPMQTISANSLLPQPHPSSTNLSADDRDFLIRTIAFEAANETDEGKAAVGYVILNRAESGRWGGSIKDVVMRPWQFEPWMTRRSEMERLSSDDPRYQNAARIVDALLSGETTDPTEGATHFLNPSVVRQRRGGSLPLWARGEGQTIGRHIFYRPDEGGSLRQATMNLTGVATEFRSCPLEAGEASDTGKVERKTLG